MLNQEEKQKLAIEIQKKIPSMKCPMCGHKKFLIADGYFSNSMQSEFGGVTFGGPTIPTIAIICENCGFVSQHALGVLKLLPINLINDESGQQ